MQYRAIGSNKSINFLMLLCCCLMVIPSMFMSSTTSSFDSVVTAWAPPQHQYQQKLLVQHRQLSFCTHNTAVRYSTPKLGKHQQIFSSKKQPDNESISTSSDMVKSIRSIFTATSVLTVGWWLSSVAMTYLPPSSSSSYDNHFNNPIMAIQQHVTVNAKEMASGSGSRVNKDPESLLRYGLPIQNKEVCINCQKWD